MKHAVLATLVAAVGLAGCSLTQPAPPPDNYYRLDMNAATEAPAGPVLPGIVQVDNFTAGGLAAERPLVYSFADQPQLMRSYTYHLWTDSPTVILREALVSFLREAEAGEEVVTPDLRMMPDFTIRGHISRLEQVLAGTPNRAHEAVVEMEFAVSRLDDNELLLLKTYKETEIPANDTPEAAVVAINEAVQRIYASFLDDLRALNL